MTWLDRLEEEEKAPTKRKLLDYDRHATQLEGMRRALEMTDGVICKRQDIQVNFVRDSQKNPAWCLGGVISLAVDEIPDLMSMRGLGTLIGLNYHEVAHTLYSPTSYNELTPATGWTGNFIGSYLILEENRVETLMVGRYAAVRKHFLLPVLTFLKKQGGNGDSELFLLTHGRRYIPRDIRQQFREMFEKQHGPKVAEQCAAVIDEYRFITLATRADYELAGNLINKLSRILNQEGVTPPLPEETLGNGGADKTAMLADPDSSSAKDRKKDADKAKQEEAEAEAQEEEESAADPEDEGEPEQSGGDAPGDDEEQPGDDEGDGGADSPDGDGEEDGADDAGPEDGGRGGPDQQGEAGEPATSGGGPGEADGAEGRSDRTADHAPADGVGHQDDLNQKQEEPDLDAQIDRQIEELLRDETVVSEVRALRGAMNDHVSQNSILGENPARDHKRPVTPEMVQQSDDLYRQLQELWAQLDPGWNFGVSEGARLDMNRVFNAQTDDEMENVYIEWEPGRQDSSGVEAVIVGDESGSMRDGYSTVEGTGKKRYQVASENIWSLRYALDRVSAKTTVLTFQQSCRVLYNRDEETDPGNYHLFSSDGGTYPATATVEARRVLAVSDRPHKVAFFFTDGSWGYQDPSIGESLDAMEDVLKVCILIRGSRNSGPWKFEYADKFDLVEETTGDMMEIMARVVIRLMERIVQ